MHTAIIYRDRALASRALSEIGGKIAVTDKTTPTQHAATAAVCGGNFELLWVLDCLRVFLKRRIKEKLVAVRS